MTTIEKILGVRPSSETIKAEFDKRKLSLSNYEIVCEIVKAGKLVYMVHGFQSSESSTPENALMKYLITSDEVSGLSA